MVYVNFDVNRLNNILLTLLNTSHRSIISPIKLMDHWYSMSIMQHAATSQFSVYMTTLPTQRKKPICTIPYFFSFLNLESLVSLVWNRPNLTLNEDQHGTFYKSVFYMNKENDWMLNTSHCSMNIVSKLKLQMNGYSSLLSV